MAIHPRETTYVYADRVEISAKTKDEAIAILGRYFAKIIDPALVKTKAVRRPVPVSMDGEKLVKV